MSVIPARRASEGTTEVSTRVIVFPFGKILAGPAYDAEMALMADLDLGKTIEGKFDLDVAGHYSRPDIFRFSVNES